MSNILEAAIDSGKELTKSLETNKQFKAITKELNTGVMNALDKASKYIIRALPIPDCAKDVLIDVKDSLKSKDIKTILNTAVNSSIREGLELLGLDKSTIKSVFKLKDAATKGGLAYNLKNSLDVISQQYLNKNILSEHIGTFFKQLKQFVLSSKFVQSVQEFLERLGRKKESFFEQVKEWYKSYESLNIDKMQEIASSLKNKRDVINQYEECEKENGIIQNITSMLSAKNKKMTENEKLTAAQLQLCNVL